MLRKTLQFILKILAILVLARYKPVIVAVTGSVGKTSTKEAIYAVLKSHFGEGQVRRNFRNYNNEIGVPLTIFGLETGGRSVWEWLKRFLKVFWMLLFKERYPKILVIEMGADRPGDIKYLTNFVRAKVGVITALGEIPVHVEFFASPEALYKEKKVLVTSLGLRGVAVLNYDDENVKRMGDGIKAGIRTFGFDEGADLRVTNYELRIPNLEQIRKGDFGAVTFKIDYKGSTVPVKLFNVLGKHQVYPALAAAAVGTVLDMNLVEISEGLKEYRGLPGRMRLLKGIKNTLIIDDSYNAAPLSTLAALETLKEFKEQRKIAVLGDMLEIGQYATEAHKQVGKRAAEVVDLLFCVGERARFITEGAAKGGLSSDSILGFCESKEAGKPLQEALKEGDVILVKGSRAMKMEEVVREIMAEPRRAEELLVQN